MGGGVGFICMMGLVMVDWAKGEKGGLGRFGFWVKKGLGLVCWFVCLFCKKPKGPLL